MKHFKTAIPAILSLCFISSCYNETSEQPSSLNYARMQKLDGSLLNVLNKFENKTISETPLICVTVAEGQSIQRDSLIMETKMAIYSWLKASSEDYINLIKQVEFSGDCLGEGQNLDGKKKILDVVIPSPSQTETDSRYSRSFNKPQVQCQYNWGASCQMNGVVLAYASMIPFSVYSWGGQTQVFINEAPVAFNGHIMWTDLKEELSERTASLGEDDISLLELYENALIIQNKAESSNEDIEEFWDTISILESELEKQGAISQTKQGLNTFVDRAISEKQNINETFTPTYSIYSTLLHEIGHSFGLHHADNPSGQVITGDGDGDSVTDVKTTRESVMAYAERYLYLTEDDKNGIRSIDRQVKNIK